MVSLKKNISLFFINSLLFICFMGLYTISNACSSNQQECCQGKKLSCCPKLGTDAKGRQLSYDISACSGIDNPVIDIPFEPVEPVDPGILDRICTEGKKEYKYTASGCSYSTQTKTCCSDGTWSGWDEECNACEEKTPCASDADCCNGNKCVDTAPGGRVSFDTDYHVCGKQCPAEPTCSLPFGTCKYHCTCDASTGAWKDCEKWEACNPGYESVTTPSGGKCCQKADGTGVRCAGDPGLAYQWVAMGTPCWDKIDCGTGALPECNESMKGTYWSKWISDNSWNSGCGSQYPYINGRGYCQQYMCR